jgi:hypothetical protein
MDNTQFKQFSPVIRALTIGELAGDPSLNEKLRITQDGLVEVCYAPFEYINPKARIVIVGITPGRTQMLNALRECRRQLDVGVDDQQVLKAAKQTGAFSGAMRPNLVALLNQVGLQHWLGISSCDALFGESSSMVQTTSVLRNPVFVNGDNYNGTPNMLTHPLLKKQLLEGFGQDAKALPDAVFIPLGDKVAQALHFLADRGYITKERILDGLPHPSGANAERIAYFLGKKERSALSSKTSPAKLDQARDDLMLRIAALA